ncbi:NRX2A protein, partial [Piaya cayana]|nr:NRX2A protein [Piaya cayana]
GPVGYKGSIGNQGAAANQDLAGNQGFVDHQGPMGDEGLVGNQSPEGNQGLVDHQGPIATQGSVGSQGLVDHQGLVATWGSVGSQGPEEQTETRGHQGSQAHVEPDPSGDSVSRSDVGGDRAHQVLKIHRVSVANAALEDHLETKVDPWPVAHLEPKVDRGPTSCLDLKVTHDSTANGALEDHPEPKVDRDPTSCLDLKVTRDPAANWALEDHPEPKVDRGPTACPAPKVRGDSRTHLEPRSSPPGPHVPSGARLLLVLLAAGSLLVPGAAGAALEFGGAPGQWARYGRWAPGLGGQLSFSLKTNVSRALVLYLDDGGNCDFLELLVAEGRLRLRFAIACAEPATVQAPAPVSDGRWHMVLVTRNARETALAVDGE